MAELQVTIDGRGAQTGARQVTRSLDSIRRSSLKTNDSLGRTNRNFRRTAKSGATLGQALGALAGVLAIGKVIAYNDAWTLVQNRIRLVTDGSLELIRATEEVFRISQEARVGLAGTAELYQRLARSSQELGISQQRTLDVTRTVSKAITISGVSATSATAAIVQLGQGLASGTLRGDELRSVLEQTPRLARAIADGLQVPIGALRELGKQGKITSEAVITALESQADAINSEFGSINVTVGQAFTQLENSVTRFIGRFNESTGAFDNVARSVQLLSKNVDGLGDDFFETAFEVSQFVNALAGGFSIIDEQFALLKNTIIGTLAETFAEAKRLTEESIFYKFSGVGLVAALFGDEAEGVAQLAADERLALEKEFELANQVVANGLDEQRRLFEQSQADRKAARDLIITNDPEGGGSGFTQPDPKAAKEAERLRNELERLGKTLTEGLRTPFEEFQDDIKQLNVLLDAGVISTETYQRALVRTTDTYRESLPEVEAYNKLLEEGAALTQELLTPAEQYIQTSMRLFELLGAGAITQETYNRALEKAREELEATATKNDQLAKFLEQVSIQAARNIQSAFADFLFDPLDDGFEGLLSSFVDTLRRMAAEALSAQVFNILGSQLGALGGGAGAGGGVGGFFTSLLAGGFADGGDFSAGRPILVGEQGPEIITPRSPGTVIPNGAMGQSAAPQVTVPVNIQNITDPSEIASALNSSQGQSAIVNAISQNPDAVRRALN